MTIEINKNLLKKNQSAFTLLEMITVITVASILMMATMEVYSRVRHTSMQIESRLNRNNLATEILQRMAEDLDRIAAPGYDSTVTVQNKLKNGYNVSQLVIENKYYSGGSTPRPGTYQKVTWQTDYDPYTDTLILYRSHDGLKLEDGVINRDITGMPVEGLNWFVPLCDGITYFAIQIPRDEDVFLDAWTRTDLPKAITVSVSFALPVQNEFGEVYIPENEILYRTIAIDRTRKINFKFEKQEFDLSEFENDPNQLTPDTAGDQDMEAEDLEGMDEMLNAAESDSSEKPVNEEIKTGDNK